MGECMISAGCVRIVYRTECLMEGRGSCTLVAFVRLIEFVVTRLVYSGPDEPRTMGKSVKT